jgi:hypothetical protein
MKLWSLIFIAGAVAAGCAASSAPEGGAPGRFRVRSEPDLLARLDEAEREVQAALLRSDGEERTENNAAPTDERKAEDAATERLARTEMTREKPSRCSRACRALGSMDRAAERLCELTGNGDERCESARGRVEAARGLVARSCDRCS